MRIALMITCLASPTLAWEASSEGPVCLLGHNTDAGDVLVSHDPRKPLAYAIQLRRSEEPWGQFAVFAIRFEGPRQLTISTDRHSLSQDGRALTVTDRGFENVLRGLEGNAIAIAVLGEQTLVLPLQGAAPEVAKFRACATGAGV